MQSQPAANRTAQLIADNLKEYLERFEQQRKKREDGIRKLALKRFHKEGDLEFDPNVVVSEGDDNGAYVMAWKWVAFDGTKFDKEKAK